MVNPELQSEFKDSLSYRVSFRKTLSQKPTKKKNIIGVKRFYVADYLQNVCKTVAVILTSLH